MPREILLTKLSQFQVRHRPQNKKTHPSWRVKSLLRDYQSGTWQKERKKKKEKKGKKGTKTRRCTDDTRSQITRTRSRVGTTNSLEIPCTVPSPNPRAARSALSPLAQHPSETQEPRRACITSGIINMHNLENERTTISRPSLRESSETSRAGSGQVENFISFFFFSRIEREKL